MFAVMYMWWFWTALMLVFLMPVGYGWGYRGWGAPYPSYIQRRRMEAASSAGTAARFDHQAWGRGGDLVWGAMFLVVICLMSVFWWR